MASANVVIILQDKVYMTVSDTAKMYSRCERTIRNDIKAMKESGRYNNRMMVLDPEGKMLVNSLMLEDWMSVKHRMKHKNLARDLEPFDAAAIRRARGEYTA